MRKILFILLVPVYILTTGCPPEDPPIACLMPDAYRSYAQERFARLYRIYVRDTNAYDTDTIFISVYPDSLGEIRRMQFKYFTDSCQVVADTMSSQLCSKEQSFDNKEQQRISKTPFPFHLFTKRKTNPFEEEASGVLHNLERVTDSVYMILCDTTNI
jgi:hypothetical protein